jgi:putative transposase
VELQKRGFIVSRRRISRIMNEHGLVSCYTKAKFKPQKTASNESKQKNELNRQFKQEKAKKVVVSDITYVRVASRWNYIGGRREVESRASGTTPTLPSRTVRASFDAYGSPRTLQLTSRSTSIRSRALWFIRTTLSVLK